MHADNTPWRTHSSKKTEDQNKETDVKCEITFKIICDDKVVSQVKSKLYPPRKQAFLFICHHMAGDQFFFSWNHEYKDHLTVQKLGNIQQ